MVDKIEMSLDDIIKKNKIGFRRSGGAGGSSGGAANKARKTNIRNGGPRRNNQQTTTKFHGGRPNGTPKGGRGTIRGGVQARKFSRVSEHRSKRLK